MKKIFHERVRVRWPLVEFYTTCISATANARDFKFCKRVGHAKSLSCDEWVFPEWAWSGSREQFLHCGLRKFRHSKSSVYAGDIHNSTVVGLFMTPIGQCKPTRSRHGWVHMFITHCPTVTLQLHNFDFFRTCRTSSSALLRGNWQDFSWHDASRGPSAIAELFVLSP